MADSHFKSVPQAPSDSSDEQGYDSEAVEISKTSRSVAASHGRKRRKPSQASESEDEDAFREDRTQNRRIDTPQDQSTSTPSRSPPSVSPATSSRPDALPRRKPETATSSARPAQRGKKKPRPGVIYLSSLPPYLRPSALRNLLAQRGFGPITRLFLTPTSKSSSSSSSSSNKSKRQMYSEGWIEFASHKTAKKCAQTLNAQLVGGKKGGYYRDDLWNMKYLRGMGWEELMAGVREERREEEARRDEERREMRREEKVFLEGVERGRRREGMRRKRDLKGVEKEDEESKRTWRQFEVRKEPRERAEGVDEEARKVLGKIF